MREFVPAGSAALRLRSDSALGSGPEPRAVTAVTVLPMINAGAVSPAGEMVLALQTASGSGDPSRDYVAVLERLAELDPGARIESTGAVSAGPRLQDVLDLDAPFEPRVHDGFDFWRDVLDDEDGSLGAAIERAGTAILPSARLPGPDAAYWCRMGDREYLRWVFPQPEDQVVDALARLHAAGTDPLGPGTRLIGAFRASGLLVGVWDLVAGAGADVVEEPARAFSERYAQALEADDPLSPAERSARAGLLNRQQTLR